MKDNESIKILLAYDQQLIADGLECILSNQKDIIVVRSVNNDEDIFRLISKLKLDIIILEYSMWFDKHLEIILKLHSLFVDLKILIVSELLPQEIMKMIMPYIHGYLMRTCSSGRVILAIHEVFESGKYLCPRVLDEYFDDSRKDGSSSKLTLREKEVLKVWIESKNNSEIANDLYISESTVRSHLKNIREKLGNLNHLQMMIYACSKNIINRDFKPTCPHCRLHSS